MTLERDAFWHIGVLLTLVDRDGRSIINRGLLPLAIKKEADKFVVKVEGLEQTFSINPAAQDEFYPFHEYVFNIIKEHFAKGVKRLQTKTINKIGFIS